MFYSPGDDNWWIGSWDGSQLPWQDAGNTVGFGHKINDGRPFWIGKFTQGVRDNVLFYYPGNPAWWTGDWQPGGLAWNLAGTSTS